MMKTKDKACPFCGGRARYHARQIRFIGQNELGDKKIRMGGQYICDRGQARGPIYTADVVNPGTCGNVRDKWLREQAKAAWNRRAE